MVSLKENNIHILSNDQLYEIEINKYKKDKDTCGNLFYLLNKFIPMTCVYLIKEYDKPRVINRYNYITRCENTYLQLDECYCSSCKDHQKHVDDERVEDALLCIGLEGLFSSLCNCRKCYFLDMINSQTYYW